LIIIVFSFYKILTAEHKFHEHPITLMQILGYREEDVLIELPGADTSPPLDPGGPTIADGDAPKEDNGTLLLLETPPDRPLPDEVTALPGPFDGFPEITALGTEPPPGCFGAIFISSSISYFQSKKK
jgi:hypothetical protein